MATQLELPNMNDCPRCFRKLNKRCKLCNGSGKIDFVIELFRTMDDIKREHVVQAKEDLNRLYGKFAQ